MSHDVSLAPSIRVHLLSDRARLPSKGTGFSAGWDVYCAEETEKRLGPGERHCFRTDIAVDIPHGYEVQVRPRSGLALRQGITVVNTPGTVDSDYTGQIGVILINHDPEVQLIAPGTRIAQLVVKKVESLAFVLATESLAAFRARKKEESSRGQGGFGSTGSK